MDEVYDEYDYDPEYDLYDDYGNRIDDQPCDDDYGPEEWCEYHHLYKAENGHLAYIRVTLLRYSGQDWGECESQEHTYNVRTLLDEYLEAAIKQGKTMKPGETADFYPWYDDDEDEAE
jgi:hypothetical protein